MTLTTLIYFACNKGVSSNDPIIQQRALDAGTNQHYVFEDRVTSVTVLSASDTLVTGYKLSDSYKQLPASILSQIKNQNPTQINYDAAKMLIMTYKLSKASANVTYNSLAVYEYKHKYMSIIVKNEKLSNGFAHISLTDVLGNMYFDFQVNKQNMFGKYHSVMSIPFETIAPRGGSETNKTVEAAPTCMESTSTFTDCISCAISECLSDWMCAVGCGLASEGCVTVWVTVCAID